MSGRLLRRPTRQQGQDRHPSVEHRVVHQVSSVCLSYPDDDVVGRLPVLRAAVAGLASGEPANRLTGFLDDAAALDGDRLRERYVRTFDFDRKHALHLSYWLDGDTRRRGASLAVIKQRYRDSGWVVDTRGELPDHLPIVLEFAALVDPVAGRELLVQYRAGLELLRLALIDSGSPYADVLRAVCATLPGPSPHDRAAARALAASGPMVETVGLEASRSAAPPRHPLHTGEVR